MSLFFERQLTFAVNDGIDIDAESDARFDDKLQRAVRENWGVRKFSTAEVDK